MSTTIESLELEILSSSQSAESGLDNLTASLEKLKAVTKGGLGLTAVAKQIKAISGAVNDIDSNSVNNVTGLAKAIQLLGGTKVSSTIATQITAMSTALNGANFTGGKDKLDSLVTALSPLSNLPKTNLASYVNNLKKLPEALNALDDSTISALAEKIQKLATALKPLGDEMQKVANGFSAFPTKIQKLIANTDKLSQSNKKASASYINLWAKLKMGYTAVKGVATKIASAINETNEYIENVNLFTVSMGKYATEAREYAEKVGDLMGIDPGEWMRNQGIFMTLATGFGVVEDRAYTMSQQLTQLGYDLSSFFNIGYEEAMQKLQSGLSGELEPLRRLGYDLSQAKLQAVAAELGIKKTISSMTQAEKAQLRYYAIMTQVTKAQGDMSRTLDAPANQLRIFKSQVTQAARAIGSIFIPALNAVLPYAIAFMKVVRIIANEIASLFGFELPEVDYSGLESSAGGADESLNNATEAAKKLKSYMLGFDELNVLDPNAGSGLGGDNLSDQFDFELPTYDFIGEATESRVAKIVEEMKEWLGLTGEINTWSDFFDTKLGKILECVGLIGIGIAAWKVTEGFLEAISALKILLSSPSYTIAIGVALTITGFAFEFRGIKDAVENGLDGFNFAEIVGGGLLGTGGAALLGSKIAAWIGTAFEGGAVDTALSSAASNLGLKTASSAGGALGSGFAAIIAGIPMYFTGIYDAITEGSDWLNSVLMVGGGALAGWGTGTIVGAIIGSAVAPGWGTLIGAIIGELTAYIIALVQNFEEIEQWFKDLPEWVQTAVHVIGMLTGEVHLLIFNITSIFKNWDEVVEGFKNLPKNIKKWFKDLGKNIGKWFDDLWKPIKEYDWSGLGYDIGQWFGNAWQKAVTFVTETIPNWFSDMWESIKSAFKTFFTETLPTFFTETIPSVVEKIGNFFKELPEKIYDAVKEGWNWLVDVGGAIIDGIWEGLQSVWTAITDFVGGFVQGFKDALGIHSPSTVFAEIGNFLIDGLFWGMLEWLGDIKEWCKTHIVEPFNQAMDGVLSFAVNVVNGAKQWWNNVKTWWAETAKPGLDAAVNLVKKGWTTLVEFVGNAVSVSVSLVKKAWTTITTFVGDAVSVAVSIFKSGWSTISSFVGTAVSTAVSLVKSGWSNITNFVGNTVSVGINLVKDGWSSIKNWLGDLTASLKLKLPKIGIEWGEVEFLGAKIKYPKLYTYAQGGFPDMGQMFIAREAGPELVGTIGNRSAVANNDQIVESVSTGVYQAVVAALGSGNEEGGETQIIINLDGEKIYANQQKIARNRGYNLGMGAFSFG